MKDVTHVQICLLDFIIIFVEKLMNASYLWFKTIKQFKLKLLHTNYLSNLHSFSRNLSIFSEKNHLLPHFAKLNNYSEE